MPFLRQDAILLFTVMAIYSLVAFWDLGSLKAPQSDAILRLGDTVEVYTGEEKTASCLYWYLGNYENRWFTLEYKTAQSDTWQPVGTDGICLGTYAAAFRLPLSPADLQFRYRFRHGTGSDG